MISILLNYLPSADTPPIRLCRTSPASGGRINRSMLFCRDMAPWLSIHSPTAPRGEGGGVSHQRGNAFPTPAGRLYGFSRQRRHKKWRPKGRHTFPAERYYITPEGGSTQPACKAKPITGRTLAAQGQRPGGWLNPHARKGVSTYGNTGKHRPDPGPDRAISPIKKAALRQQVDGN